MSRLSLEVITPHGRVIAEEDLAKVVLRRFEPRFARGSQVVFLPNHGSETVHIGPGIVEYWGPKGGRKTLEVAGGFAEIDHDRVTVLTAAAGTIQ